jgi:hypothetical protein
VGSQNQAMAESSWDKFVHDIGQSVYFFAFPTATYKGVELTAIRQGTNGTDVVFKVYGISAFDGDSLWTEVITTVKNSSVVDLRWGANNAILAKPGETMKSIGKLLEDINKQSQASQIQSQTQASTVRLTWVLANRCGYSSGLQVRFFDVTNNFTWPAEGKVFVLARGETREISVDTYEGGKVCIGAAPYVDSPNSYWGVGILNEQSCKDCCYLASNARVSWPLSCP